MNTKTIAVALLSLVFLSACKKKLVCENTIELTANTVTPTIGDDVIITVPRQSGNEVYQWTGPGVQTTNQVNVLQIDDIVLSESGKYYCNRANSDCNSSLSDSIEIDVQLKQETPPCSLTDNYAVCDLMPNVTFESVTQGWDGTFDAVSLEAYGGLGRPKFTVLFNSPNGIAEPRDGTHTTIEVPIFSVDKEPNTVSISFIYQSRYFHSKENAKVYVSHVNGKLRVSFCNVVFYATTMPNITCSARMIES